MGLAGPRNKQRISIDPQNKKWSQDKSKYGMKLMKKMGWEEGKGLGSDMSGQTEHIKVFQKTNNLGIGATKKTMDNWLDNTNAFSELLKKLNERVESGNVSDDDSSKDDKKPIAYGRLYHRKKFLRNKIVSNYDKENLDMILGVRSSSNTATPVTSEDESEKKKKKSTNSDSLKVKVQEISASDYFANKKKERQLKSLTNSPAESESEKSSSSSSDESKEKKYKKKDKKK